MINSLKSEVRDIISVKMQQLPAWRKLVDYDNINCDMEQLSKAWNLDLIKIFFESNTWLNIHSDILPLSYSLIYFKIV